MNHRNFHALVAAACLGFATSAGAFTIDSVSANGNLVDTSFGTSSMLSLDIGLLNTSPVDVTLRFDATDAPFLPFNALVKNFIGLGFESIRLDLTGSQFSTSTGTASGTFGSVATMTGTPTSVTIHFDGPEYVESALGNWYLDGAGVDFGIASQLSGPVTLSITAAVPEPGSYALMLSGLAFMGWAARRRQRG